MNLNNLTGDGFMTYAARVCPDGRIQTVKGHTDGVCLKAEKDALRFGTAAMTKLICLLHDMGKNPQPLAGYGGKHFCSIR